MSEQDGAFIGEGWVGWGEMETESDRSLLAVEGWAGLCGGGGWERGVRVGWAGFLG